MRNQTWEWIIWLILLILLNAIALAAGRGERRGGQRDSSAQQSQPQQSRQSQLPSRPARSETRSAPSRSPQSAPASEPRARQSEPTRAARQITVSQQTSSSGSDRGRRSVLSQSQPQGSTSSRPVRREVIVAPSSQSMDTSSSLSVSRSVSSSLATRASQSGRTRTVEVMQPKSEQSGNITPAITPSVRKDSTIQTTQPSTDKTSSGRRSLVTVLERQSRDKVGNKDQPKSKDNTIIEIPANSQKTKDSIAEGKSENSRVSVISGNSRTDRRDKDTDTRLGDKQSDRLGINPGNGGKVAQAKPDKNQLSGPDVQKPGSNHNSDKLLSNGKDRTRSILSPGKDITEKFQKTAGFEESGRSSDSRWSKLRSKITTRAQLDMQSHNDKSGRGGRNRSDEGRGSIVVNDNNIRMERGDRGSHHRPHVSRHLIHDIRPICDDHRWRHHGSYFSYHWSDWSCGRVILAPYNDCYGISYYYPSYHRKYLFVSLGGYWPYSYRYHRYYWYGCHPYHWYGSYVVSPEPVVYDYTTYNYYYTTPTVAAAAPAPAAVTTEVVEDSAATDTPLPQTQADINFANAVNAFDEGRYDQAAELFREAILQSPEDEIIPFTYTQALFASENYALAAYVLREVMTKMPADEPAVYFPRGLYKDDQTLLNQIARLESAITIEPFSTDYQLLLGYQYLGIAQWDKAVNALDQAARNPLNTGVVNKLLDIAEKMEKDVQPTVTAPQS